MCTQKIILGDVRKYYEQFVAVKKWSENTENDVITFSHNKELTEREALKQCSNPKIFFFCAEGCFPA